MAGIATATPTQNLKLRDEAIQSLAFMQVLAQGQTSLSAQQVIDYDAALLELKAAVVAITG